MKTHFNSWNLKTKTILIAFAAILTSCLGEYEPQYSAYGDALTRVYQDGDSLRYQVELYLYSNFQMSAVTASTKSDPTTLIELDTIRYKYTFVNIPSRLIYNTTAPKADHYLFDILFESGEKIRVSDYLDSTIIAPPQISNLEWNKNNNQIEIEWDVVKNAQYYKILLLGDDKQVAFETDLLHRSQTSFNISKFTNGWQINQQPTENKTYKIQLNAYLFEPVASTFDIQCIATNDQHSMTWLPPNR